MIKKSIDSILNQTYSDLELIVIVDTPDREDLISLLVKKSKDDNRIRTLRNEKNIGLTASLNKGIDIANGKYIARMDADDISIPVRLEKQLTFLKEKNLDLVGCNIININEQEKVTSRKPVRRPCEDKIIKRYLRYNSPLFHPTWLGKAELFKKYKYIDFPACEDYELLARIALDGKKLGNLNEVLLKYRLNNSSISNTKKALQKTALSYIRKRYRDNKVSSYEDYIDYLKSSAGAKKQHQLARYYQAHSSAKTNLRKKKYVQAFSTLAKAFAVNPSAREELYSAICSKLILKWSK